MIKKLFLASIMMLTMFSFSSCCDGDDMVSNNGNGNNSTAMADYTFILWGVVGGADSQTSLDFISIIDSRRSGDVGDNFNFVGRIKTSGESKFPGLQNKLKAYGYDGTITFDIGKKSDCTLTEEQLADYASRLLQKSTTQEERAEKAAYGYKLFFDNITSAKTAGLDYPFNDVDSLASFIKSTAASHPAKNYVLIIDGHGNGFDIKRDFKTRATLGDEDTGGTSMSEEEIAKAVKQSGVHFQTLVNHSCEMAALENFPYFQQIADYAFMSSEVTTTCYLPALIAYFSKAGNDLEKIKEAGRNTVDTYIENVQKYDMEISSMGFYDLSKTQDLMTVTKRTADWYSDAVVKDPEFINGVLSNSICSQELTESNAVKRNIIFNYQSKAPDQMTDAEAQNYAVCMMDLSSMYVTSGFVLSHIMYQTLNMKSQATAALNFTALQSILDDYVQTLKSMAYIKALKEDTSIKDYNYIFTSPSICIVPLNAEYNKTRTLDQWLIDAANGNPTSINQLISNLTTALKNNDNKEFQTLLYDNCVSYVSTVPYTQMQQNYKGLLFDQQTGWSSFLQNLKFIPTYATIPTRIYTLKQQ